MRSAQAPPVSRAHRALTCTDFVDGRNLENDAVAAFRGRFFDRQVVACRAQKAAFALCGCLRKGTPPCKACAFAAQKYRSHIGLSAPWTQPPLAVKRAACSGHSAAFALLWTGVLIFVRKPSGGGAALRRNPFCHKRRPGLTIQHSEACALPKNAQNGLREPRRQNSGACR